MCRDNSTGPSCVLPKRPCHKSRTGRDERPLGSIRRGLFSAGVSTAHWFERARPLDPSRRVAVGPTTRPPDQLLNSNGARMCDALGCRRHVRLVEVHRGVFCRRHAAVAANLRARIAPHRGDAVEAEARVAEIVFRKRPDHGHVHYAVRLSKETRWVDARAARDRGPAAVDLNGLHAPTDPIQQTPTSWFGPEPGESKGDPGRQCRRAECVQTLRRL